MIAWIAWIASFVIPWAAAFLMIRWTARWALISKEVELFETVEPVELAPRVKQGHLPIADAALGAARLRPPWVPPVTPQSSPVREPVHRRISGSSVF
jgi:hypothetical protein